jgi:hypothetical protein
MKIVTYTVPVTLTRDPQTGEVDLAIHDDRRTEKEVEQLGSSTTDIVMLSKNVGDENENTKRLVKSTLFASEKTKETAICLKYIQ